MYLSTESQRCLWINCAGLVLHSTYEETMAQTGEGVRGRIQTRVPSLVLTIPSPAPALALARDCLSEVSFSRVRAARQALGSSVSFARPASVSL